MSDAEDCRILDKIQGMNKEEQQKALTCFDTYDIIAELERRFHEADTMLNAVRAAMSSRYF